MKMTVHHPDFTQIIGKKTEDARLVLATLNYYLRVVCEDREEFVVTQDIRLDRVNVAISEGKVVAVRGVG